MVKKKIELQLSSGDYKRLQDLARDTGCTESGVFIQALKVIEWIRDSCASDRYPIAPTNDITNALRRDAYTTLNWDYLFPGMVRLIR